MREKYVLRCHGCSETLTRWTFTFYLVAIANFHVRMISATQIKIKIESSFTQRVRATLACLKPPNVFYPVLFGSKSSLVS